MLQELEWEQGMRQRLAEEEGNSNSCSSSSSSLTAPAPDLAALYLPESPFKPFKVRPPQAPQHGMVDSGTPSPAEEPGSNRSSSSSRGAGGSQQPSSYMPWGEMRELLELMSSATRHHTTKSSGFEVRVWGGERVRGCCVDGWPIGAWPCLLGKLFLTSIPFLFWGWAVA